MDWNNWLNTDKALEDPFILLGVSPEDSDEEIRQSYENKCSLSRGNQNMLERLNQAYTRISSLEKRINIYLLGPACPASLYELEKEVPSKLQYLGPGKWIQLVEKINSSL